MSEQRVALQKTLRGGSKIDQGMLRYVLDQSRDCIKILSPSGTVEYINSEGQCALQISNFSAVHGRYWPDLWPEMSKGFVIDALDKAKLGESSEFQASRPDYDNEMRWWQVSVSPLLESDGELAGILTSSRDVTSYVRSQEAQHTLALEMRHRLRNAYTIASAIVMQSSRADHTREFAESVCSRLANVALSQTRLLEAGHKSWTLSDLVQTLVAAHGDGAHAIRFAGNADAAVDGHGAMLIALVLGELTNNSVKYGALRRRGPVSISWLVQADALTIHWREAVNIEDVDKLRARDESSGYSLMQRMARSQRATFAWAVEAGELHVSLMLRPDDSQRN